MIIAIISALALLATITVYACCRAAGRYDEDMDFDAPAFNAEFEARLMNDVHEINAETANV